MLDQEEILCFQKSKENCIKFGNRNTKNFHTHVMIKRGKNKANGLFIDNTWITDETIFEREAIDFFKNCFNQLIIVPIEFDSALHFHHWSTSY